MNLYEPVSGRQFAKMVGQSEGAVRKAVARQSIVDGLTADGKYIPITASNEWGKPILPEFLPAGTTSNPAPAKQQKKKITIPEEAITADQIVNEVLNEKVPRLKKTPAISSEDFDDEEDEDENNDPAWISKPEAERRTAIHKSEILQIALAEKRGQLIPKEKISTILFGYGQEIRVSFESLTNRVLDRILAAETRHEAKRILDEEIHATLTALADIPNRNI